MWESVERESTPLITAQAFAKAMGGKGEVPTLHEARQRFDAWLFEPPERVDWHDAIKRQALGLSRGR
jgi:hypothetical protein